MERMLISETARQVTVDHVMASAARVQAMIEGFTPPSLKDTTNITNPDKRQLAIWLAGDFRQIRSNYHGSAEAKALLARERKSDGALLTQAKAKLVEELTMAKDAVMASFGRNLS